jgi:hypothetical protein
VRIVIGERISLLLYLLFDKIASEHLDQAGQHLVALQIRQPDPIVIKD